MIHVLAIIHAGENGTEELQKYEAQVMPILEKHGGKLLSAFKPRGHENGDSPDEIHLIEFPSQEAFQSYRADPGVAALSECRQSAISETTVYVSEQFVSYAGSNT
jgi:uncharacterized protein (DUF1330 family)